ncbi:MAG TPA: hypothetical protein VG735_15775 [Caulobacterales bacterium]|nr:hypothetical protein [Caulobacterales bacterium]
MTILCLTLDIDWAIDEVIRDALALVNTHNVAATWFLTHETPVNAEIASRYEVGLHPNFNPLFEGGGDAAADVLAKMRKLSPQARVVRSHSLTRSSRLAALFFSHGFTHESNVLVPPIAAGELQVWRDFSGLIEVPIRWEDDVRLQDDAMGEPADWLGKLNLLVADFHPIHVFLNTATIDDYERARPVFRDFAALTPLRRPAGTGGTRDRLIALLERARALKVPSVRLGDLTPGAVG